MKILLLIIPLMLLLSSCKEREIDEGQLQDRNGVWYAVNEDKPYTGKVTGFFSNGQQKMESTIKNGKATGLYRIWYKNGQLLTQGNQMNGEIVGLVRSWHENGQLNSEQTYENGKLGLDRSWDENGKLERERCLKEWEEIDMSNCKQ